MEQVRKMGLGQKKNTCWYKRTYGVARCSWGTQGAGGTCRGTRLASGSAPGPRPSERASLVPVPGRPAHTLPSPREWWEAVHCQAHRRLSWRGSGAALPIYPNHLAGTL